MSRPSDQVQLWHSPRDSALTRAERREHTAAALTEGAATTAADRLQALDYVIEINMGVARSIASRYFRRGIDEDDLVQVAYLALTRAVHRFDPSWHKDFLSYAVPTIRGELKKHFRDRGWTVRPPRRIQELQAAVRVFEGTFAHRKGRTAMASEVADGLGVDVEDVLEAQASDGCFTPSSLDRPAQTDDGKHGSTLGDLMGENDPAQLAAEARVVLRPVVRRLQERDRRILYLRFVEGLTQQEIGDAVGVTQMQVSRLLSRILRDLRLGLTSGASSHAARLRGRQGREVVRGARDVA